MILGKHFYIHLHALKNIIYIFVFFSAETVKFFCIKKLCKQIVPFTNAIVLSTFVDRNRQKILQRAVRIPKAHSTIPRARLSR